MFFCKDLSAKYTITLKKYNTIYIFFFKINTIERKLEYYYMIVSMNV